MAGEQDVIDEARVWQARHGGRLIELYPYTLAAELGLDERLPRMAQYTAHARAVAAALSEVPGVRIVPDPPQVNMMHLLLAAPAERVERAVLDVARERRAWTLGRVSPTLDAAQLALRAHDGRRLARDRAAGGRGAGLRGARTGPLRRACLRPAKPLPCRDPAIGAPDEEHEMEELAADLSSLDQTDTIEVDVLDHQLVEVGDEVQLNDLSSDRTVVGEVFRLTGARAWIRVADRG